MAVDTSAKRSQADRVRREVSTRLAARGFRRTKPTLWVRERALTIEYLHLHLFSYTSAFRIHCGLRVRNDTFDAAALNGPCSRDSDATLEFAEVGASIAACASGVEAFVRDVAEPWFSRWQDLRLLASPESPLDDAGRRTIQEVLQGRFAVPNSEETNRCLGVA